MKPMNTMKRKRRPRTVRCFLSLALLSGALGACTFPTYRYLACEPGSAGCLTSGDGPSGEGGANVEGGPEDATREDSFADATFLEDVDADAKPPNLVEEPGCEAGVGFWNAYRASVACTAAQHRTGAASFLVTFDGSSSGFFSLTRAQPIVDRPPMGTHYVLSAWVRSDSPGRTITAVLRAEGGASAAAEKPGPAVTSSSTEWRRVTTSITIDAADRAGLSGHFVQYEAVAGDSFHVDDVELIVQ
jgi:hypothetical protein